MKVRFIEKYCADINNRISYELVSDEKEYWQDDSGVYEEYYNTKLLGLVPVRKMEEADGTEVEAINVFVKLSNL